ncbi:MAG: ATP-binding domain-containing protein, partial [Myxococcota bacterium]
GEREEALSILDAAPELHWGGEAGQRVVSSMLEAHSAMARASDPHQRHALWRKHRVLCAHRRGAFGVNDLNARMRRELGVSAEGGFDGLPVFVRRNDPSVGLFNGDVGIMDGRGDVAFESSEASLRRVPLALVPPHDDAFSMTVHQSQGSEFERVSIVLAAAESQLASRELLYTAITRAREAITLFGRRESVAAAIDRKEFRDSGLGERLGE